MTPELQQLVNLLIIILTPIATVASGYSIVKGNRREKQREEENRTFKPLYEGEMAKRLQMQDRIDEQDTKIETLVKSNTELTARLTIMTDVHEKERQRYQGERDDYMRGQGRLEAQIEGLQLKVNDLSIELKDLRNRNEQLIKDNQKLDEYREIAREQKRQLEELQSKLRQVEGDNQRLKDRIRLLESRLNPEPPTPNVIDLERKDGTDA